MFLCRSNYKANKLNIVERRFTATFKHRIFEPRLMSNGGGVEGDDDEQTLHGPPKQQGDGKRRRNIIRGQLNVGRVVVLTQAQYGVDEINVTRRDRVEIRRCQGSGSAATKLKFLNFHRYN